MYMPEDIFTPTWSQRRFRYYARRHWGQYSIAELCTRAHIGRTTFYDWCHLPGFVAWLTEPVRPVVRPVPAPHQHWCGDSVPNETVSVQDPNTHHGCYAGPRASQCRPGAAWERASGPLTR